MTPEQALNHCGTLETFVLENSKEAYLKDTVRDVFSVIRSALREQTTPCLPLTVEELRAMPLQKWVWVEILVQPKWDIWQTPDSGYYQKKETLGEDWRCGTTFTFGHPGRLYGFEYDKYGEEWLAYNLEPSAEGWRWRWHSPDDAPADLADGTFLAAVKLLEGQLPHNGFRCFQDDGCGSYIGHILVDFHDGAWDYDRGAFEMLSWMELPPPLQSTMAHPEHT